MLDRLLTRLREAHDLPTTIGDSEREQTFLAAYFKKYPRMERLFGTNPGHIQRVYTESRGSEHASTVVKFGKVAISLSEKFWKEDATFQHSIFTHEVGHHLIDTIGLQKMIDEFKKQHDVDIWTLKPSTMDMPFQVYSFEEAFAETFSVLVVKDSHGLNLLKQHWPKWQALISHAATQHGLL